MQDKPNIIGAALLAVTLLAGSATASAADDAPGIWLSGTLAGTMGDDDSRWLYSAEAHARYFDIGSGINQWLVRPAVGYALGKDVRAWVGYSRYRIRSRTSNVADENRYWQELDWKAGAIGHGSLSLRGRLEQRDISLSSEIQHVMRLRVKYARTMTSGTAPSLVLSAESFIDLNETDWAGSAGLAQYRLYGGVEWQLGSGSTLEVGYLHQHIELESQVDRVNHLAVLGFKVRLQ